MAAAIRVVARMVLMRMALWPVPMDQVVGWQRAPNRVTGQAVCSVKDVVLSSQAST